MSDKELQRLKRHGRMRKKLVGTPERPRLSVHRSAKNLYAQVIDDIAARTLFSFSTRDKAFSGEGTVPGKTNCAKKLGNFYASKMKEKGITKVAFDRGGYKYHGRIKALADALREGGIQF